MEEIARRRGAREAARVEAENTRDANREARRTERANDRAARQERVDANRAAREDARVERQEVRDERREARVADREAARQERVDARVERREARQEARVAGKPQGLSRLEAPTNDAPTEVAVPSDKAPASKAYGVTTIEEPNVTRRPSGEGGTTAEQREITDAEAREMRGYTGGESAAANGQGAERKVTYIEEPNVQRRPVSNEDGTVTEDKHISDEEARKIRGYGDGVAPESEGGYEDPYKDAYEYKQKPSNEIDYSDNAKRAEMQRAQQEWEESDPYRNSDEFKDRLADDITAKPATGTKTDNGSVEDDDVAYDMQLDNVDIKGKNRYNPFKPVAAEVDKDYKITKDYPIHVEDPNAKNSTVVSEGEATGNGSGGTEGGGEPQGGNGTTTTEGGNGTEGGDQGGDDDSKLSDAEWYKKYFGIDEEEIARQKKAAKWAVAAQMLADSIGALSNVYWTGKGADAMKFEPGAPKAAAAANKMYADIREAREKALKAALDEREKQFERAYRAERDRKQDEKDARAQENWQKTYDLQRQIAEDNKAWRATTRQDTIDQRIQAQENWQKEYELRRRQENRLAQGVTNDTAKPETITLDDGTKIEIDKWDKDIESRIWRNLPKDVQDAIMTEDVWDKDERRYVRRPKQHVDRKQGILDNLNNPEVVNALKRAVGIEVQEQQEPVRSRTMIDEDGNAYSINPNAPVIMGYRPSFMDSEDAKKHIPKKKYSEMTDDELKKVGYKRGKDGKVYDNDGKIVVDL